MDRNNMVDKKIITLITAITPVVSFLLGWFGQSYQSERSYELAIFQEARRVSERSNVPVHLREWAEKEEIEFIVKRTNSDAEAMDSSNSPSESINRLVKQVGSQYSCFSPFMDDKFQSPMRKLLVRKPMDTKKFLELSKTDKVGFAKSMLEELAAFQKMHLAATNFAKITDIFCLDDKSFKSNFPDQELLD